MIRLLLIIAARLLQRITCAEPIAIHTGYAATVADRWLAIDSAHVATVQTELERTRQAGQPGGSNARRLLSRFDVRSTESEDKPP